MYSTINTFYVHAQISQQKILLRKIPSSSAKRKRLTPYQQPLTSSGPQAAPQEAAGGNPEGCS
jgi:hypothetical protein